MDTKTRLKYLVFFFLTIITTTLAGAEWMFGRSFIAGENTLGFSEFLQGFEFSLPFLGVLSIHEFGHYYYATKYKVPVKPPFYIPFWLGFLGIPSLGTAGAFIRLEGTPKTTKEYFDIGVAGPLFGFIAAIGVLMYGFTHLPPPEYIFTIHPEYKQYGLNYASEVYKKTGFTTVALGDNLTFNFFRDFVCPNPERIPNAFEIFHYPWLFAGYLSLVFTALNLIPVGQLDGGHLLYSLFGTKLHSKLSPAIFLLFLSYAGMGNVIPFNPLDLDSHNYGILIDNVWHLVLLYVACSRLFIDPVNNLLAALSLFAIHYGGQFFFPRLIEYNSGLLLFAVILGRFLGIYHPPATIEQKLDTTRIIVAIITILVLVVSFTPVPLRIL